MLTPETLRLWEHAERIRSGELPELAPLLVLCEDAPEEATLHRERALILSLDVPRPVRADLLAVAVTVGTRFFARALPEAVFQEEMLMLKEASFLPGWCSGSRRPTVSGARRWGSGCWKRPRWKNWGSPRTDRRLLEGETARHRRSATSSIGPQRLEITTSGE